MHSFDHDTASFSPDLATKTVHDHPFRVIVLDGAFEDDLLQRALEEWPDPDHERWHRFEASHELEKYQGTDPAMWSPAAEAVLSTMGAREFCDWLAAELGIGPVESDTWGGGYHETRKGGFLQRHADLTQHPELGLWRRANALLFLNEGWEPAWGGPLEVGPPDANLVIEPSFNRLVCFATASTNWHGHPTPWQSATPRRSLATFYYQPAAWMPPDVVLHSTRWYDEEPRRMEVEALRAENGALRDSLFAARVETLEARAVTGAYERSRSWRFTAPLRALRRSLGRG